MAPPLASASGCESQSAASAAMLTHRRILPADDGAAVLGAVPVAGADGVQAGADALQDDHVDDELEVRCDAALAKLQHDSLSDRLRSLLAQLRAVAARPEFILCLL